MRRRRISQPDSLELLLDTICNTFGGVLFIAILVIILTQLSGKTPAHQTRKAVSPRMVRELSEELTVLRTEITTLKNVRKSQNLLERQLALDENTVLEQSKRQLLDERDKFAADRDRPLVDMAQREAHIQSVRDALVALDQRVASAERELKEAQTQADNEKAARTREARTPVVHTTSKRPIAAIVRYGRLYIWHRYGEGGLRLGLNTDDFAILGETSDGIWTSPNPSGGIALTGDPGLTDQLAERLRGFRVDGMYLDLAVRSDSFAEFHHLRKALSRLGYEYSILLLEADSAVYDRGGSGRGVQ